jgi:hypothetical protein
MKQKRSNLQKDILFILISSFIVVVAWIGFNIYHIWATSTVSQNLQLELTPISPEFDQQTMQQLKTRENIQPLFENPKNSGPNTNITPTPAQLHGTIPTPIISGIPQSTIQNTTPTSNKSQIVPTSSSINRLGQ